MTGYALAVFVVAALGGLVMAMKIFSGKHPPWLLSLLHAALGATGLVLLVMVVIKGMAGSLVTGALVVLLVAALGGFYLASQHAAKKIVPKSVVIIHAAVAATGVVILLASLL